MMTEAFLKKKDMETWSRVKDGESCAYETVIESYRFIQRMFSECVPHSTTWRHGSHARSGPDVILTIPDEIRWYEQDSLDLHFRAD